MLKKLLLAGSVTLASALSVAALESPYVGNPAPSETATYYLYNVESGLWLQDNCIDRSNTQYGYETYCANLWIDGLGFIFTCNSNGSYYLDGGLNLTSHYLNNETLAMNQAASEWYLEAADVNGVENAYYLKSSNFYLGNDGQGNIYKNETYGNGTVWQLVSRDERIAYARENATKTNPVNLSWLIPAHSFAQNDTHTNDWKMTNVGNRDGLSYNKVRESYNVTPVEHSITITDIPNGTYRFNIRGYYREASSTDDTFRSHLIDEPVYTNAEYFAGDKSGYFKGLNRLLREQSGAGSGWKQDEIVDNRWFPNGMQADSDACAGDQESSLNDWVEVYVVDNKLYLGVRKEGGRDGNRLVWDDFRLEYVSTQTGEVDLTSFIEKLTEIINTVEADLQYLPNEAFTQALADAKAVLAKGEDATPAEYTAATDALQAIYDKFDLNTAKTYHAILALAIQEQLETDNNFAAFNNASDNSGVLAAIKDLRWARRRAAAFRHVDNFEGSEPAEGDFYLFNVGQRQFLNQGSDWHTHANVAYHGLHCSLEPAADGAYNINTNVISSNSYLNHGGYTDCGAEAFMFVPADDDSYYITYTDGDGVTRYLAYDPSDPTDAGNGDETTVSAKCIDMAGNKDAMWKLVSAESRMALLENASSESPVDVTFMIENPGFDKQKDDNVWNCTNITFYANGSDNYNDRIIDCYGMNNLSISQTISGLPAGLYTVMVQGCYRHCSSANQFVYEYVDAAYLYGMEMLAISAQSDSEISSYAETPLMNIFADANKAPGEGTDYTDNDGNQWNRPNSTSEAVNFFHTGLYSDNAATFEKKSDESNIEIGIFKDSRPYEGDMVQADNFRLLYLGKSGQSSLINEISTNEASDCRIFNLQGIEVKAPIRGTLYIQSGRKFIAK